MSWTQVSLAGNNDGCGCRFKPTVRCHSFEPLDRDRVQRRCFRGYRNTGDFVPQAHHKLIYRKVRYFTRANYTWTAVRVGPFIQEEISSNSASSTRNVIVCPRYVRWVHCGIRTRMLTVGRWVPVCMALYIKPCGYSIEHLHDRNMAQEDSFVMKKSTARATDPTSSAWSK